VLGQRIFVAGHRGMVGSAISRQLQKEAFVTVITATKDELDLTNQNQVNEFFKLNAIDQVYLAAAKVGGIQANSTYPAEFI
jgi:GDP-L-fucose synthase